MDHLTPGGIHGLPTLPRPTAEQATITTFLPGAHQRGRRGRQCGRGRSWHGPSPPTETQCAEPCGPPAGQVETAGSGAAAQHLRQTHHAELGSFFYGLIF